MKIREVEETHVHRREIYGCDLCGKEIPWGKHVVCDLCGCDLHADEAFFSSNCPEGAFVEDRSFEYCHPCEEVLKKYWAQMKDIIEQARSRLKGPRTPP